MFLLVCCFYNNDYGDCGDTYGYAYDYNYDGGRDDYDDLATVNSGQRHLFLPAPGSSGIRDHLFDAVFGL